MVSWRRGIEPVIAAVILIAVAIVVAVAVVGWILGLWGGLAGGNPQIAAVNPVLCADDGSAAVYIRNTGSGSDKLLAVYLDYGGNTFKGNPSTSSTKSVYSVISATSSFNIEDGVVIIPANKADWIYIEFNQKLNPGDSAIIKLMFEKSGTQSVPVTAQSCGSSAQSSSGTGSGSSGSGGQESP